MASSLLHFINTYYGQSFTVNRYEKQMLQLFFQFTLYAHFVPGKGNKRGLSFGPIEDTHCKCLAISEIT